MRLLKLISIILLVIIIGSEISKAAELFQPVVFPTRAIKLDLSRIFSRSFKKEHKKLEGNLTSYADELLRLQKSVSTSV